MLLKLVCRSGVLTAPLRYLRSTFLRNGYRHQRSWGHEARKMVTQITQKGANNAKGLLNCPPPVRHGNYALTSSAAASVALISDR